MSLKEMQDLSANMVDDLKTQQILSAPDLERLFRLPDSRQVQSMSVPRALFVMVLLDLVRPFRIWALRRRGAGVGGILLSLGGILPTRNVQVERAIALASSQATLAKRILFLSKTHHVFHLWHVIHRPFSLTFAILVILHVGVVISLGYF
jgi:hypothetical protein